VTTRGEGGRTVYVRLLDEGVEVWRPAAAVELGDGLYRLMESDTCGADELWEFPPGSRVRCEVRQMSDGPTLVAVAQE
jgi:hypothetical protein